MPSASAQQAVVSAYIGNEVTLGRLIGPLPPLAAQHAHHNRIGVIPKGHAPDKWRLITDLSFPLDRSVNDSIDPSLCSLSYVSIDAAAAIVAALGAALYKISVLLKHQIGVEHSGHQNLVLTVYI